jgi:hypothetical protein
MPRRQQQPPLARLAAQQKHRELDPLITQTERDVRSAFAEAHGEVAHVLAQFAHAYGAELDRVNADRDEDEEPDMRRVSQHWLTSSGWGARVQGALSSAAQKAGQRSLAHITHAHDDAAAMGQDHAQALIKAAMKPAVNAVVHRRAPIRGRSPSRRQPR